MEVKPILPTWFFRKTVSAKLAGTWNVSQSFVKALFVTCSLRFSAFKFFRRSIRENSMNLLRVKPARRQIWARDEIHQTVRSRLPAGSAHILSLSFLQAVSIGGTKISGLGVGITDLKKPREGLFIINGNCIETFSIEVKCVRCQT